MLQALGTIRFRVSAKKVQKKISCLCTFKCLARIRMGADQQKFLWCVCVCCTRPDDACFVPRTDYAATHANGFCIYAHQRNASKRAFTCVKMRRSCTPADYIYILDVVLRGVLLYLPDKIEQNMALGIRTQCCDLCF